MTMVTDNEQRRTAKLEQIRKLLDRADSTDFAEEAEACRKKADDLMLMFTISEFEVNKLKDKNLREKPETRHIKVCDDGNPIKIQLVTLFNLLAGHARCRAVFTGLRDKDKSRSVATVVGFPSDIAYVEMLFTSLHLQLSANLKPHPDPALSEVENIAMLKEAGLKWESEIWPLMRPGQPYHRPTAVQWGKDYTQFCKDTERPRNYSNPKTYQINYAEGFSTRVGNRLWDIRQAQKQETTGTGMELALRDIKAEVDAAYQDQFPNTHSSKITQGKFDGAANRRGVEAGSRADLGQGRMGGRKELNS